MKEVAHKKHTQFCYSVARLSGRRGSHSVIGFSESAVGKQHAHWDFVETCACCPCEILRHFQWATNYYSVVNSLCCYSLPPL